MHGIWSRLYLPLVLANLVLHACSAPPPLPQLRAEEGAHAARVMSLSWSPDGHRLASASFDGTVTILEAPNLRQERVVKCSSPYVLSVDWSPNGKRISTITNDAVQLFDPETGSEIRILITNPPQQIPGPPTYGPHNLRAVWSPDGKFLALMGWSDGAVRVLDGISGTEHSVLRGHTKSVNSGAWSPDGKQLATAGWDNTIRIWNTAAWEEKNIIRGIPGGAVYVAWSPDGRLLSSYVAVKADVQIFDLVSGNERILKTGAPVIRLAWRPIGTMLAVGLSDGTMQLWDPAEMKVVSSLRCGRFVDELAWESDGALLAAVPFRGNTVCLWDMTSASQASLKGHRLPVITIAWRPGKPWLASGGYDGKVRLWQLDR
jgi:WD40 repeat protein